MNIKMLEQAKPILMSTPMVQASMRDIDPKTQTRRVIKPQGISCWGCKSGYEDSYEPSYWLEETTNSLFCKQCNDQIFYSPEGKPQLKIIKPSYRRGDILWVRETWQKVWNPEWEMDDKPIREIIANFDQIPKIPTDTWGHKGEAFFVHKASDIEYADPENNLRWHPSIFMPREAARLFLRMTGVRAERVQDISEVDALAEGIQAVSKDGKLYKYCVSIDDWIDNYKHIHKGDWWAKMPRTAVEAYRYLWDKLNAKRDGGKYAWDMNPWVWVYTFERIAGYSHKQIGGRTYDTGNLSISN